MLSYYYLYKVFKDCKYRQKCQNTHFLIKLVLWQVLASHVYMQSGRTMHQWGTRAAAFADVYYCVGLISTNRVCPRHGISSCPLLLQHILLRHSHLHKTTHSWCLSKGICWTSKLMPEVMYPEFISSQSLVIQTFTALSLRADRCCCYNVLVCFSRQGFPV